MSGTKDITLTGPKALRGIRNSDLYPQSELNISDDFRKKIQENFARSEYSNYNAAHGHLGYQALNNPALYEVQVNPNLDYGSSVYDEGLTINPDQQDIDNLRFANQSWFTQAFNGIAKGTILAGTTFIDGTLGLVTGIGLSVVNAFSDDKNKHWYEGIWDNPVTKAMNAVNKEMEDVLINYRSEEQTNGPWYSADNLLSANFIFDTVIKNMGFTIGAAYSGAVYTKGISLAANLLGRMKTAGAAVKTIEAGQKAIQLATATRRTKALIGSFFNAQAEAVTEAYNAKQDFILTENQRLLGRVSELKSQALKEFTDSGGYLNDDGTPDTLTSNPAALAALNSKLNKIDNAAKLALDEIQKRSRSVGTMTGLSNLPILFGSDLLMFGKMYAGGWKSTRNANKTVTRATKEALKDAEAAAKAGDPTKLLKLLEIIARAEETGYQGLSQAEKALVEEVAPHTLSKGAGIAWNAIKTPLSEGNEEMMQSAVSQAATYRYQNEVDRIFDSQLDIKATNRVRGYLESIFHGIKSQYGNLDNYEEAFVGAITGILGSPTFGRSNNSTDLTWAGKGKLIGMSGGVFTEIRDYLRDRKAADDAARDATTVLRGGGMPDLIKHLIASSHFDEVMEQAIIHDDEKEYKDARTALAFEMITKLKRAGRLDLLLRAMEVSAEFTDEDINELAEEVSKQVSITTPDIKSKKLQRDALLKLIEDLLSDYETYLQMAMDTGDSSALDTIDEMLTEKRLQVERLDAEIKQAKPVAISPYIKEDGTAFTAEEIKEDINKRISKFQTIIDTITLAQDEIDSATSEALTNELLDTLTWYKVMMNDWNERSHKITEKWNLQLEKLANDPDLQTALKSLQLIEDIMEEAGFTPEEAKILLGGRFDELLRVGDYKKLIEWLLKAIQEGGMSFAYLLSSDKKVDTGNGVLETVGDIIFKLLEWVLNKDSSITTDIKEAFRKSLQDLRSIGYGHRRYNLLLDEFLRDPSNIDAAHLESVDKALQEQISQAMQEVIDGIDWNSSDDDLAKYLRDNKDKINLAGGLNSLLSKLDKDKLDKIKKARSLNMGLDALDSLINESDLEDDLKNLLRKVVDDNVDDADDINDLAKKVKDAILDGAVEEELKKNTPNEGPSDALVRKIEAAEIALNKFLDNTLEKLTKATEEALRALDREQEEEERRVKELADIVKDPEDPAELPIPEYTEPSDTSGGTRSEDPAKDYTPDTTSDSLARKANKKRKTPQAGAPGHNRRRQISQYYLHGEDKETLPEHYEKHPEDIPDGVDKLAFLKYIKAVHKKLVESGAYTYISGTNPDLKLKKGLEIRFTTDTKLNEEAGVPVILMVVTDEQGHDLIIGSLPTSLDFQCKQRGSSSKTVGEARPEDKKLYEALCKELIPSEDTAEKPRVSKITTKVEALMGGYPSLSSLNRSVAEVFGNTQVPITIFLTKGPRSSKAVKNPLDTGGFNPGLVCVYVTTSTGAQIPMMCISTALKDLDDNDWYILEAAKVILKMSDPTLLGSTKDELLRWLPFFDNLHVNIMELNGSRLLVFGWGVNKNGEIAYTYSIKLDLNGNVPLKDAVKFIKAQAKKKIPGKNVYPLANVDRNRLNDEEYMSHITRYIKVNMTSNSPRAIDDWFIYEPTEILKLKRPSGVNPTVTPTGLVPNVELVLTDTGEASISSTGTVTTDSGPELSEAEKDAIRSEPVSGENITTTENGNVNQALNSLFGGSAQTTGEIVIDDIPKRRRRRKLKDGEAKFSLVPQSEPLYTPEMQSIKDKAIANGTFMKAPNGNPTNLTERQWLQVRTKNFINWFGDWINNPSEASKVVDENGEPLVVYHGSKDNSFTIFDSTKNDKGQKGFFFTNDRTMASSYGKNPRAFFINSRNPYIIEGHNNNWNNLIVGVTDIAKDKLDSIRLFRNDLLLQLKEGKTSKEIYDYWNNKYFKLYDKYLSLGNSFIDKIKKIAILYRLNKFEGRGSLLKSTRYTERVLELDSEDVNIIFKSITDYGPVFNKEASVNMINNVAANVYVVTKPNNIKSATSNTGEFSTTNDDTRYLTTEDTLEQLASRDEVLRNLDKVAAMFPNLAKDGRIVLVKGLMDVVDKNGNPRQAYGMFRNGILYISDQSPKGTAFHEAFHYVADTLLTDSEWETMFDEASKLWGNLPEMELEENLAEAFREFMNEREDHSVKGRLKNIFQKLKHVVLSLVGRENYLDSLFWNIYRGKIQRNALNIRESSARTSSESEKDFELSLLEYRDKKLSYDNLDLATKEYLNARGFTKEAYEKLSIRNRELLLQCM